MAARARVECTGKLLASLALACAAAAVPAADPGSVAAASAPAGAAAAGAPQVALLRIAGAIGPATEDYVRRGLERAARGGARLAVLQIDTPGGLDSAMRGIVKAVLASPVPVAGYVAPSGARAASAGTYILYACHVAAMAPATNLGAATPVALGLPGSGSEAPAPSASAPASGAAASHDVMTAKRMGDAAAYIRSLAQLRGRNAKWAEQAVRESVSLAASEALAQHVIDIVAEDVPALLRELQGRTVAVPPGRVTLDLRGAELFKLDPDWRNNALAAISDPNVALLLMMVGIYGLLFEFMSPGFVLPGVVGGICLLLGLFALQMLPINHVGLALLLLGLGFFVAEAFVPSFGALGLGGIVAFAFGALMLFDEAVPGFEVARSLVAALGAAGVLVVAVLAWMAARMRAPTVASGDAVMIGRAAQVLECEGTEGWAEVAGERWRVRGQVALQAGQAVRVDRVEGLTLHVRPLGQPLGHPTAAHRS